VVNAFVREICARNNDARDWIKLVRRPAQLLMKFGLGLALGASPDLSSGCANTSIKQCQPTASCPPECDKSSVEPLRVWICIGKLLDTRTHSGLIPNGCLVLIYILLVYPTPSGREKYLTDVLGELA